MTTEQAVGRIMMLTLRQKQQTCPSNKYLTSCYVNAGQAKSVKAIYPCSPIRGYRQPRGERGTSLLILTLSIAFKCHFLLTPLTIRNSAVSAKQSTAIHYNILLVPIGNATKFFYKRTLYLILIK